MILQPRRAVTLAGLLGAGDPAGPDAPLALVHVLPARVTVSGIDGEYSDPAALQQAGETLLRAAGRLSDAQGGRPC